ncbi:MAG: AraC family transcriptional regulator [Sphingobacteriia bacterium]
MALVTTFKPNREDRLANFYLAAYFWCFGLSVIISMAVVFGYSLKFPHLFRLSFFPGSLIMPFAFLYLMRKLYARKPSLLDLIHFLPFFLYLLDYFPFLMLSADEKLHIYIQEAKDPIRIKLAYSEGWFMPEFGHVILRYVLFFGYWIAQVFMLYKAIQNPNHPLVYQDKVQKNWLQILVGTELLAFLPPLLALWLGDGKAISNWINVAAIAASIIQVYYLIFHPEVLYSLDTAYVAPESFPIKEINIPLTEESSDHSEIPTSRIHHLQATEDVLDTIHQVVEAHMYSIKPFTKPRYSISDLSDNTSIPVYRLSIYINQRYQVNFYGYINQFRIEYFLNKIAAGEHKAKTLEALSWECGFQSRATFVRAFKLKTGITPSEYISRLS